MCAHICYPIHKGRHTPWTPSLLLEWRRKRERIKYSYLGQISEYRSSNPQIYIRIKPFLPVRKLNPKEVKQLVRGHTGLSEYKLLPCTHHVLPKEFLQVFSTGWACPKGKGNIFTHREELSFSHSELWVDTHTVQRVLPSHAGDKDRFSVCPST